MMNQTLKVVLWLDDQFHFLEEYQEELSSDKRLDMVFVDDVDQAIEKLRDPGFRLDLMIWDMMVPHGSLGAQETEGGLHTGQVIYKIFRDRFPVAPAILFTNVTDPNLLSRYDQGSEVHSWVFQKRDLFPEELAAHVATLLHIPPQAQRASHGGG